MPTAEVASDSSSKTYTVTYGEGQPPTCTCVAFAIRRNRAGGKKFATTCKHIDRVMDGTYVPADGMAVETLNDPAKLAEALSNLTLDT